MKLRATDNMRISLGNVMEKVAPSIGDTPENEQT